MEARVLTRRPEGFTLMEVLIAMVLLGITLLGVQAAMTDRLIKDVGEQDKRTVALQLAMDRLQVVQTDPVYGALETRYSGTENNIAGFPRFVRATTITRTLSGATDYKVVTVTVTRTGLPQAVTRSVTIAAP